MLRVIHLADSLGRGGAERHLLNIAAYLKGRGVEQLVVQLCDDQGLLPEFTARSIQTLSLGFDHKIFRLPLMLAKFFARARPWRPQIIVTQLPMSDIVGRLAARQLDVPTLSVWQATRYGPEAAGNESFRARVVLRLLKKLECLSLSPHSRFIAVSKAVEINYREALGLAPARCTVIPNTVDLGRFPEIAPLRNFDRAGIRLLHVGRHVPQKGLSTLLQALALLPSRPEVLLDLIGGGPLTRELKAEAFRLGLHSAVVFRGSIHNIVPALLDADLFVLPSHYEGLSLAYLEALAAGLPVIASDISENIEVDPEGAATLFFKAGDAHSLAARIQELAGDKNARLRLAKRAPGIAQRFQIERIGPAFLEALSSAAAGTWPR